MAHRCLDFFLSTYHDQTQDSQPAACRGLTAAGASKTQKSLVGTGGLDLFTPTHLSVPAGTAHQESSKLLVFAALGYIFHCICK